MHLIDQEYTKAPFYGYRKMTMRLNTVHGHQVNHKRVARLMDMMGLQTIYPGPRTSVADAQHREYPYLLRGLIINRPNQSRVCWPDGLHFPDIYVVYFYIPAAREKQHAVAVMALGVDTAGETKTAVNE
jgi:hypothetical protein